MSIVLCAFACKCVECMHVCMCVLCCVYVCTCVVCTCLVCRIVHVGVCVLCSGREQSGACVCIKFGWWPEVRRAGTFVRSVLHKSMHLNKSMRSVLNKSICVFSSE
jgi:hypothetical protein